MSKIEKVIRDGMVAVLYSPGYGAGWYSWNTEHKQLLFHPLIVEKVEANKRNEITEDWVLENLKIQIYAGGAQDLRIEWMPEGTAFMINEYDGSESIEILDSLTLTA